MNVAASSPRPAHPLGAGVGLRLPHLREVAATLPAAAWFEVHPENVVANPHARELLRSLAERYPLSLHTVGLSVGSAGGVDREHLARIRVLADELQPFLLSGHLAWSTHAGEYLNDLLPLPYDEETLAVVADEIDAVQTGLRRVYHLENPSSYFGFAGSTMTEVEFLTELVRRTGCRLLCDVSNVHVSSRNLGYDPIAYLDGLPAGAVGELHLGGFAVEPDQGDPEATVIVDTHDRPIDDAAWVLYSHAVARFGRQPTLIEWDADLPTLAVLLGEAARADAIAASTLAAHVAA
ncbi:MAG: DUF692 domain-containing protein [Bauldia sp.]